MSCVQQIVQDDIQPHQHTHYNELNLDTIRNSTPQLPILRCVKHTFDNVPKVITQCIFHSNQRDGAIADKLTCEHMFTINQDTNVYIHRYKTISTMSAYISDQHQGNQHFGGTSCKCANNAHNKHACMQKYVSQPSQNIY
jgi:hypothetical protein